MRERRAIESSFPKASKDLMPVDVGVVGQGFVGSQEILFGPPSASTRGHGSRDGRTERIGSVTGLLHDQGERVRGLFLLILGAVPSCHGGGGH